MGSHCASDLGRLLAALAICSACKRPQLRGDITWVGGGECGERGSASQKGGEEEPGVLWGGGKAVQASQVQYSKLIQFEQACPNGIPNKARSGRVIS